VHKLFWLLAVAVMAGFVYMSVRDRLSQEPPDPRAMAARQSVETIMKAQSQYRSRYGQYAEHLWQLGPGRSAGGPSEQGARLLPGDLADGERAGYRFRIRSYGDSFAVSADPQPGLEGLPHYFADQTGVIRKNDSGPANESSPRAD